MAARAWSSQQRALEETFFQNDAVSLCLLVNRRAKTMRVVDFRAGASPEKGAVVHSLAEGQGVDKVYTLVERDEVASWVKLGFTKEGNIPGFYKRSDAFILGSAVRAAHSAGARSLEAPFQDAPLQSETRIVAAVSGGGAPGLSPAQELMERTLAAGKRGLRALESKMPHAKLAELDESEAKRAVLAALRAGRAMTAFEPFGRGAQRTHLVATLRGGVEVVASFEMQACFGNALLELLTAPRGESDCVATAAALEAICARMRGEGAVSCFSLTPSSDVHLASAFLHNGFRRTGLLHDHLLLGGRRRDAILWSRKLATPGDE